MSEVVIGIDLGTTNSVAAHYGPEGIRFIPNETGELLTPSAVAFDERTGSYCVGRRAKNLIALDPRNGARKFKTTMGTDAQYTIRKDRFNSIELSSMVLKSLKADAERLFGFEVNRAVITVPAYFSEAQRQATRKAGEMAGLTVERILNEPTAAAIAYGLQKQADVHRFLIFDLGGGTFDVCVMEHDEGILETLSVAGISQLGGEDFSHALLNYVLKKEGQDFDRLLSRSPETAGLMMKRAELAKQQLSTNDTVPLAISGSPLREKTIQITREEADEVFAPLIRRLATPCQTALRGASTKISNLDAVVLVGGATRMPCVRNFIEDYFETEALAIVDPDLTVAQGAAIQAALYTNDEHVDEVTVTDVLSHSLGIEISKMIGNRYVPGFFSPIIHRNTVIPATRAEIYKPLQVGQTVLNVEVYEGEGRHVKDNHKIGTVEVRGIPNRPDNQVEVRFSYDLNGILEVEATILATNQKVLQLLTRDSRTLSAQDIKEATERMSLLKLDLREDRRIRALLVRAELLIKDLPPEQRNALEAELDRFESALDLHDREQIEALYNELKRICDSYGAEEQW